jgi:hypothetical protein
MALTKEDLDAIKTTIETTVAASEHRLKTEMDKRFGRVERRFDSIHKAIDNAVAEIIKTEGELYEEHEDRIKVLEREIIHTT